MKAAPDQLQWAEDMRGHYLALVAVGFTEDQALAIVLQLMMATAP